MRRNREVRRQGFVFVGFWMSPAAIKRLIALGWLKPEDGSERLAVAQALLEGTHALWPGFPQNVTRHLPKSGLSNLASFNSLRKLVSPSLWSLRRKAGVQFSDRISTA